MSAIAIIPARSGSRRIPFKNRKFFHGKPIISYPLWAAHKSGLFDNFYVSTDDEYTIEIAVACGAGVHIRSKEMSVDEIGTQEVAKECLKTLGYKCEYACVIYPCSPLLEVEDLRKGYEVLRKTGVDYVYSTDMKGVDCGNYYWGKTEAFIEGRPLERSSLKVYIPKSRAIDINEPEDWERAEQMYEEIHGNIK